MSFHINQESRHEYFHFFVSAHSFDRRERVRLIPSRSTDAPYCIVDSVSFKCDISCSVSGDSTYLGLGLETMEEWRMNDNLRDERLMRRLGLLANSRTMKGETLTGNLMIGNNKDIRDFLYLIKRHYEREQGRHAMAHYTVVVG